MSDLPSSQIHDTYTPKVGGRLHYFQENWQALTSDPFILNAIKGYKLEFKATLPPSRDKPPRSYRLSETERKALSVEINKLYLKGVIEPCSKEKGDFVSNVFSRPKKNGGTRLILDLTDLNKFLPYQHFKMENIHTASQLLSNYSYMASVDLQDAYYAVPIHPTHRKFFRFIWEG